MLGASIKLIREKIDLIILMHTTSYSKIEVIAYIFYSPYHYVNATL